jgi:hypothetical protein
MAEHLSEANLYGYGKIRACRFPDTFLSGDGVEFVPKVDFDAKNQNVLPCNTLAVELGVLRRDLPMSVVPARGCFEQRNAGLCPRGLDLTDQEIETSKPL